MIKVGFPCQRAQCHLSDFASAQVLTGLSISFPIRWSVLKNLISLLSSEWLYMVMIHGSLLSKLEKGFRHG